MRDLRSGIAAASFVGGGLRTTEWHKEAVRCKSSSRSVGEQRPYLAEPTMIFGCLPGQAFAPFGKVTLRLYVPLTVAGIDTGTEEAPAGTKCLPVRW